MKKKPLASVAGLALALAGFVLLTGFHGGCGHHPRTPAEITAAVNSHLDGALDDLDATPAQRDQIHALVAPLLTQGLQLRADGKAAHAELLAQWQSDTPDRAKLHALVDQRADAMRAFAHAAVDAAVDAHGVLTPAQRAKVTKKIQRHMGE